MSENRLDIRVIENSEKERKRIIAPVLNGYKTQFYSAFKNFEEKGVFDVIGTQLDITTYGKLTKEGWKSLHAAMSIYRNKNFETFRYLFIDKYGNLQDQCAVSCRMPNTSVNGPTETFLYNLITYAEQKDYYIAICHNHPSGNPTPSNEDIKLTDSINKGLTRTDGLNRFLGHIILDHDTFTVAVPSSERGIVWHEWDQMQELPDYEKDIDFELFGANINSYDQLVDAAKKINDTESWNDEYIPVLFSDGKLKSIQYFSYEVFLNEPELIKDTLKKSAILTGATQWFPVFTEHASKKISRENLFMIEQNCIKLVKINGATDISFCENNYIFTICEKYGLGAGHTPKLFFDRNNIKIETQTTFTVPEIDEKMFPFLKNIKANNLTAAESVVKENTPEYKTVDDIPSEYLAKRTDKLSAKLLWERLGNIPIDDNENIDEPFIFFEKGTDRFEIWHWFEEHYNISIAEELMYADFMTKEEEKILLNSINPDKTKKEKSLVEKGLRRTFTDNEGNPKIWTWIDYDDLSGHLVSPDGKSYFSYDWTTKEYKVTPDSTWDSFLDADPTRDTSLPAFKEYAQKFVKENIVRDSDIKIIFERKYINTEKLLEEEEKRMAKSETLADKYNRMEKLFEDKLSHLGSRKGETFKELCKWVEEEFPEKDSEGVLLEATSRMIEENLDFGEFNYQAFDDVYGFKDGAKWRLDFSDSAAKELLSGEIVTLSNAQSLIWEKAEKEFAELKNNPQYKDEIEITDRINSAFRIADFLYPEFTKEIDKEKNLLPDEWPQYSNEEKKTVINNAFEKIKSAFDEKKVRLSDSRTDELVFVGSNKWLLLGDFKALIIGKDAAEHGKESLSYIHPNKEQLHDVIGNGWEFDEITTGYAIFQKIRPTVSEIKQELENGNSWTNILKTEVSFTPSQLQGEKFIAELNEKLPFHNNNPWVTSIIIIDDLKNNHPGEYKLLNEYFAQENISTRNDYLHFFEEKTNVNFNAIETAKKQQMKKAPSKASEQIKKEPKKKTKTSSKDDDFGR